MSIRPGEPRGGAGVRPPLVYDDDGVIREPKTRRRRRLDYNNAQVTPFICASEVRRTIIRGYESGLVRLSATSSRWDVSGNCREYVGVQLHGRPVILTKPGNVEPTEGVPVMCELKVSCRKCPECLRALSAHWTTRAQIQMLLAPRTWMATLTIAPAWQEYAANLARTYEARNGGSFEALTPEDQFAMRHRFAGAEVTRYFKRMRKAGHKFTYLLVVERHKSGLPHYHALIHEAGAPVTERTLQEHWEWGFAKFKLVDTSSEDDIVTGPYPRGPGSTN